MNGRRGALASEVAVGCWPVRWMSRSQTWRSEPKARSGFAGARSVSWQRSRSGRRRVGARRETERPERPAAQATRAWVVSVCCRAHQPRLRVSVPFPACCRSRGEAMRPPSTNRLATSSSVPTERPVDARPLRHLVSTGHGISITTQPIECWLVERSSRADCTPSSRLIEPFDLRLTTERGGRDGRHTVW